MKKNLVVRENRSENKIADFIGIALFVEITQFAEIAQFANFCLIF